MSELTTPTDEAVKAKHRAMWALGDYAAVADDVIPDLGARLVHACGVSAGDRVLDIAAGSGNAAIPAALTGAAVVASDLTPDLLGEGRRRADARGASLTWEVADAEHLPYETGSFDTVLSCVGIMFAPRHQVAADELLRVVRPGGSIGLVNWTPAGFVGQMLAALKPFAPAPPPGAQPPVLWGEERHVAELFGSRVVDLVVRTETVTVDRFATPADFRTYFTSYYGPTVAVHRSVADDPQRRAELEDALDALAARHQDRSGAMAWEYRLLTARRAMG